ncbi:MAG: hypothetical protein ACXWEY_02155 [Bacteroidia bacterium]
MLIPKNALDHVLRRKETGDRKQEIEVRSKKIVSTGLYLSNYRKSVGAIPCGCPF